MRATSRDVRSNEAWFTSGETTSTVNENLPKDFNLIGAYELERTIFNQANVWTSDNTAKVKINSWNGSKRKYEIQVASQSAVVERSAYFPGWQVWVDGKLVKIDNQDPWNYGLLSYTVDPGEHYIVSKFTQNTFWRKLGNSLTLAAIMGILFFYIKKLIIK